MKNKNSKMELIRQGLALILAMVLVLGYALPVGVRAEGTEDPTEPQATGKVQDVETLTDDVQQLPEADSQETEPQETEPQETEAPAETEPEVFGPGMYDDADLGASEAVYNGPAVFSMRSSEPVLYTSADAPEGLEFQKTATLRDDGSYDLVLTLKGFVGSETTQQKLDLIIVLDRSNSMNPWASNGYDDRITAAKNAAKALLKAVDENAAIDAQYNIIDFGGSGHPKATDDAVKNAGHRYVVQSTGWSNYTTATSAVGSLATVGQLYSGDKLNGKEIYYNEHSTNYEAAFKEVNKQLASANARSDAMSVVVFLTDGKPTVAWEAIASDYVGSDGYGRINDIDDGVPVVHTNWEGHGTTLEGDVNVERCLQAALDDVAALDADRLYLVGTGTVDVPTLNRVKGSATNVSYKEVTTTGSSGLVDTFTGIAENLEELFFTDVTVTDILSHVDGQLMVNIEDLSTLKITVLNETTNAVVAETAPGQTKLTIPAKAPNAEATLEAVYDEDQDSLKLIFPTWYKLDPDYKYVLSAVIDPTEKAYREYRRLNEIYEDEPDPGTGTHENDLGFYANDKATVNYNYQSVGSAAAYDYPVVQLTPGKLVISKKIIGVDPSDVKDLEFIVVITYPDDGNGIADEEVTRSVPFSDMKDPDGDGVYTCTFTGLSPNTQYSVTETGGEVQDFDMSTTVTTTSGTVSDKTASGTVGRGATVTVGYENEYTFSTTTVKVEKQVTGNLGDWSKAFAFTAELSGRTDTMNGVRYVKYSKNADGDLVAGNEETITAETFDFSLKDNEYIIFQNIPVKSTLTVSERKEDYIATATLNNTGATVKIEDANASITFEVMDDDAAVFTNDKTVTIETGVVLDSLPYVLILAVAAAGAFPVLRKRKFED